MSATDNNKKSIGMLDKEIDYMAYNSVKKLVGIKVQKDGSLTRPDKIYDVRVADFIVEIDRSFLSQLANKAASDMIEKVINSCKEELKSHGLKVLSSHMQSNPSKEEPHILLSVVADERLSIVVDNINKRLECI
jgi:hypothetical protein